MSSSQETKNYKCFCGIDHDKNYPLAVERHKIILYKEALLDALNCNQKIKHDRSAYFYATSAALLVMIFLFNMAKFFINRK